MCQFASFFHNYLNGDVAVYDLNSHGDTEEKLKLNKNIWREGHYLPSGTFELRFNPDDRVDKAECNERFKNRFPKFTDFLVWALKQISQEEVFSGSLDLRGLTSAKDLVLPKSIGGSLYLSGLTSAKDLVLPKSIGGSLDLRGLTSAKDLVLPKSIGGSLYLSGHTYSSVDQAKKELGIK